MAAYRLISSDSHVYEPQDLWTSRIPAQFQDRAPRLISREDGDWWYCDGRKVTGTGAGSQTGRRFEEPEALSRTDRFAHIRPGGYLPDERIKDMDLDGVAAEVVYPTVGFVLYNVVRMRTAGAPTAWTQHRIFVPLPAPAGKLAPLCLPLCSLKYFLYYCTNV
jgi:hypothetical protein